VSLTEGPGCVFSSSEHCCYRTFDWINKNTARAQVASSSATRKARLASHPCSVSSYGGVHRYRRIRNYRFEDGIRFCDRELERPLSQEVQLQFAREKREVRFRHVMYSFLPNMSNVIQYSPAKKQRINTSYSVLFHMVKGNDSCCKRRQFGCRIRGSTIHVHHVLLTHESMRKTFM
jgi:hypothetical protein